jgi:hypothetical protein
MRSAAIAGIGFVVLNVVSAFAPGAPPASDASTAKIASYFRDHSGGIKAQLLFGGIGIFALMWWLGALWRVLSAAEGERPRLAIVAAVSLASGLTLALVSGAVNAAAAMRAVDADTTHLLYSLSLIIIAAAGLGIGTSLVATCVITYRAGITPRWASYLGWVAALAFLAGSLGTVSDSSVVNGVGLMAFLLWCVWILAISGGFWRGIAIPGAQPR